MEDDGIFLDMRSLLLTFDMFYCRLEYFVEILYLFSVLIYVPIVATLVWIQARKT
jgi:hypothetical protein